MYEYSYPGNINLLCIRLENYVNVLKESGGVVQEFVNPKYKDATRTSFLSPVRLECMMQDLPKLMNQKMNVGDCSLPRWLCFSAAKNNVENALIQEEKTGYGESMFSMEEDYYKLFRKVLRRSSILIGEEEWDEEITPAVGIPSTPIIILSPETALSVSEMGMHFSGFVKMNKNSVLYLDGKNIHLKDVIIDGSILIQSTGEENTLLERKRIHNAGWRFVQSEEDCLRK